MKKRVFGAVMVMVVAAVMGYLAFTVVDTDTPVASAAKGAYSATLYVAGMGGHFAVADVTIDPNNTDQPIKVDNLSMLPIGDKNTHPTHDPRIDVNNRGVMYFSTYKLDPDGKLHVGKVDIKKGSKIKDVAIEKPDRAVWTGANYCASGQARKSYIVVSMANEGYIEVWDKETMTLKHRVFFDDLGYKAGEYTFAHGTNTPDMKKFLLTLSLTPEGHTKWTGNTKLIMLDMATLEKGKLKKLAESTITGTPGKTITFRQYFSNDGKYLFQSGADRGYLIDAATLKVIDEITDISGENHDIIPTPDDRYAIMTLREKIKDKEGKDIVDGRLMLYDVKAQKTVGKSSSVCYSCHQNVGKGTAILCGIDANWK